MVIYDTVHTYVDATTFFLLSRLSSSKNKVHDNCVLDILVHHWKGIHICRTMSSGYASRLSEYENKGECGLPEIKDSTRAVTVKLTKLANLIQDAKNVVVITGAGISTSAGIPDFRGPRGVWTKEMERKQKVQVKKRKRSEEEARSELDNFIDAKPTICHRAITKLVSSGIVSLCEY